jgi:hypothetical protein
VSAATTVVYHEGSRAQEARLWAALMKQSAKRRAQSEKLFMSKLIIFVCYAPCAMLYAI